MFDDYAGRLSDVLSNHDWTSVEKLANRILTCWKSASDFLACRTLVYHMGVEF